MAEICAASTGATEPTNPEELDGAAAGWGPEIGGETTVVEEGSVVEGVVEGEVNGDVGIEVDDGIGTPLTWEWV